MAQPMANSRNSSDLVNDGQAARHAAPLNGPYDGIAMRPNTVCGRGAASAIMRTTGTTSAVY